MGLSNAGLTTLQQDTSPALGGNLNLNSKYVYNSFTFGENVTAGDLCYLKSDGKLWKAKADATSTSSTLLAIAVSSVSANNSGNAVLTGAYTTSGLTAGSIYYVSDGTAGAITSTIPADDGDVVRIIGYALSTTVLWFNPDSSYILLEVVA